VEGRGSDPGQTTFSIGSLLLERLGEWIGRVDWESGIDRASMRWGGSIAGEGGRCRALRSSSISSAKRKPFLTRNVAVVNRLMYIR
jgi:hypothetical protein